MDSIVLPSDFDASQITYSEPRVLDNGGKVVYVSFNKKKLIMQTPEMMAPFGLSKWNNEGKANDKYSLDLSFKGRDTREVLNKFYDGLKSFDKKLVEDGLNHCQTWLKKQYKSLDVVEALYTPIVKHAKDDKYPPTFKLSLPHNGSQFTCDVYDGNRNLVDIANLETKGARVSAIIQCVGIWIAGSKYGCSWKVLQMKITPPSSIKGYAFKELNEKVEDEVEDEGEDDDESDDHKALMEDVAAVKVVDDEDDDEAVIESDDELDVKPVKTVVKKTVKK
jgi:hypothetical protein